MCCGSVIVMCSEEEEALDADPCVKDPCQNIAKTVIGTCKRLKSADFACDCQANFFWSNDTNSCEQSNV